MKLRCFSFSVVISVYITISIFSLCFSKREEISTGNKSVGESYVLNDINVYIKIRTFQKFLDSNQGLP